MALPQQVADLRNTLREAHAAAFPSLFIDLPDVFPPDRKEAFSLERFVWAYSIVETRGLVLELEPGAKTTALVPFADMLNHKVSAALAWPTVERSEEDGRVGPAASQGNLVFRALRDVDAGNEVCLYYGRLTSLQTLQYYGFVDEAMLPYETVQVELEMPEEEISLDDLPEELRDALSDPSVPPSEQVQQAVQEIAAEQQRMRATLLQRHDLKMTHQLHDADELSPHLLRTLDILTRSPREIKDVIDGSASLGDPDSHERVCDAVREVISGLAGVLTAPAAPRAEHDEVNRTHSDESDRGIDSAIEAYVRFQQRVVRSALRALTGLAAREVRAGETSEDTRKMKRMRDA